MAIVWADFPSGQQGIYGSSTAFMLNGVWAELISSPIVGAAVSLSNDIDPLIGAAGRVFQCAFNGGSSLAATIGARFVYPAAVVTAGIGFRMWMSGLPDNSIQSPLISFRNGANAVIFAMRVTSTGAIEFRTVDSNGGVEIGVTAGPVLVANAYNHIEIKGLRDAAAGTIEVKVNGLSKLALTGLALGASNFAQIWVGHQRGSGSAGARQVYYKDIIFWDGLGTYATDFQGSISVHDLSVTSDIALNWTPSTGATGFNLIDETSPDDADYISAADPPPAAAVFGMSDLPPDVTSVRALLPIMRAMKTDGGDCSVQMGLTPDNVAWVDGANRPITTAFTYWWDAIHTSPVTAAPWTPAEVNAAYVRVNRTL